MPQVWTKTSALVPLDDYSMNEPGWAFAACPQSHQQCLTLLSQTGAFNGRLGLLTLQLLAVLK